MPGGISRGAGICRGKPSAMLRNLGCVSPGTFPIFPKEEEEKEGPQGDRGTVRPSSGERARVSQPADGPPGCSKERPSQGRRRPFPDVRVLLPSDSRLAVRLLISGL